MAYGENVTGDLPKDRLIDVTALVAPLVLVARLADTDDVINQTHLSGKQAGAVVAAVTAGTLEAPTAAEFRMATGSGPADAWVSLSGAAAGGGA